MSTTINLADGVLRESPYPVSIFFAAASLFMMLLLTPPLVSHFRNRNIGATVLVASSITGDMINFLNAIIWSTDDVPNWYTGAGFCDVEIKIIITLQVMFPAAIAVILRGLAQVMDTNSSNWSVTAAKKRRNVIIDLVCCVGIPTLQMLAQWITQPFRYYILGIAGCTPPTDGSWLYLVLTLLPPIFWTVIDVYYSILLISRLVRYRRAFNTIMINNNTTKSRFLRLYLLCSLCVIALIPVQIWVFIANVSPGITSFSWNAVHHPTDYSWDSVVMVPSAGSTYFDRWIWLAASIMIFAFFGFGRDAVKTYRELLLGAGLGWVIPSLRPGYESRRDTAGTFSTFNSRARLYFGNKGKDSGSVMTTTTMTDSMRSPPPVSSSPTTTTAAGSSSRKSPFHWTTSDEKKSKTSSTSSSKPSIFAFSFSSLFGGKTARKNSHSTDPFVMTTYNRQAMIQSKISAEPHSPDFPLHSHSFSNEDVMVRTEVRQASETVEPENKMYAGV